MRLNVSLLPPFIMLVCLPNQVLKHCLLKREISLRLAMSQESEIAKGYFKAFRVILCIVSVLFQPKIFTVTLIFLAATAQSWVHRQENW